MFDLSCQTLVPNVYCTADYVNRSVQLACPWPLHLHFNKIKTSTPGLSALLTKTYCPFIFRSPKQETGEVHCPNADFFNNFIC